MSETGRALRAARRAANLSLDALAKRTHYSKSLLGMVENGQRTATPELVAAYERALAAQGLGEDVNRRELLAAVAVVTAGAAASEPLGRLLDGLTTPDAAGEVRMIGRSEVAAVQEATAFFTGMDLRYGGTVAADVSSRTLRWAVGLLSGSMSDATRAELSSAVGALADRTAWTHHDAGRSYSARRLSTLALRTASSGNDSDLRAHVMLNIASQLGEAQPAEAARIVDAALADSKVCVLERANLHAVRARHLANSDGVRESLRHILAAEKLLNRGGEAPEWATFLTVTHIERLIAEALVAAGESSEAICRFEMILPRFGADRLRARTGMLISLATLYINSRRVDEAQVLAREAQAALKTVRSTRSTSSLTELKGLLVSAGGAMRGSVD